MKYSIQSDIKFLNDVIEWDTFNWTRAIEFWESVMPEPSRESLGLELGSRRGGLSLYFARNGWNMVTTDVSNPEKEAKPLHEKYGVQSRVKYMEMNGESIPSGANYDLITFKSVLGAICSMDRADKLAPAIRNMYDGLKPGGMLVFAENLHATRMHHFLRKKFVRWGENWNYLKLKDIENALHPFSNVKLTTIGFLACFGRNERQKRWLGKIDQLLSPFIPVKYRYIVSVVAIK